MEFFMSVIIKFGMMPLIIRR